MNKLISLLLLTSLLLASCNNDRKKTVKFFTNYQEGIQVAAKKNQPILLIFAAYASPTGKTEGLLYAPELKTVLEQYVCILLMTDDRKLSENGQTQGEVNTELQKSYGHNFQPCFLKLTPDLQPIGAPGGYMKSEKELLVFLETKD
ncbi:hypothetical protein [Lewinella cohaerens]|uniref:hypothetical protein n=1 Tax=Lewinella cohaerens TaxID=70995 RepID=UPI00035F7531|nr:hypothetical protein [Lewinella cohaerens]